MKIDVDITHAQADKSLLVEFAVPGHSRTIDLALPNQRVELDLTLADLTRNQHVDLVLRTDNLAIVQFPVLIESITLDSFYQRSKFGCQGRPEYKEEFLEHASAVGLHIDTTVADCDRLDFAGELVYTFKWPFWRNLLKDD